MTCELVEYRDGTGPFADVTIFASASTLPAHKVRRRGDMHEEDAEQAGAREGAREGASTRLLEQGAMERECVTVVFSKNTWSHSNESQTIIETYGIR